MNFFEAARSARNFWRDTRFHEIWASLLEITRGFLLRTHLESKRASRRSVSRHPVAMCTRLPSPPPSHPPQSPPRRPFRSCPLRRRPFRRRLPCCRLCILPTCWVCCCCNCCGQPVLAAGHDGENPGGAIGEVNALMYLNLKTFFANAGPWPQGGGHVAVRLVTCNL